MSDPPFCKYFSECNIKCYLWVQISCKEKVVVVLFIQFYFGFSHPTLPSLYTSALSS